MLLWYGAIALVLILIVADLLLNRGAHAISVSEAAVWVAVWVGLALNFNLVVYYIYEHNILDIAMSSGERVSGAHAALQFLTGYVVEESLSMDNVFLFAVVFMYFGVPAEYQRRVLFYGVLGALIMRGIMIVLGAAMIRHFEWTTYLFGALLIFTAVKLLITQQEQIEPQKNPLVRLARKIYPLTNHFEGEHFFTIQDGRRAMTPLFLVLLVVESTDLLFAVDSIPAVFAVTTDPFLVFTSNAFAVLGLRSLYFVLAGVIDKFRYLKVSLVFVLAFVGVKMLMAHHFPIPILVSLAIIAGILVVGVLASMLGSPADPHARPAVEVVHRDPLREQRVRRGCVALLGVTVLMIALALAVLPGLAAVIIPAGVALMCFELWWRRRLLAIIKRLDARAGEPAPPRAGDDPAARHSVSAQR